MRKFAVALALTLLPAAAFAQQTPPAGAAPGGMRGQGRMMQSTVEWLLTQKEQFRPTTEQVTKLEEIAATLKKDQQEDRDKMQKARETAQNDPNVDREAMRAQFRELMVKLRKQDDEATEDALKVLNDEQQKVVKEMLDARRKEMESRRRMN
ncbi:MAG TPA: Spy/CpxP family protein refolding chaperone [Longimicrobiales bacterium]